MPHARLKRLKIAAARADFLRVGRAQAAAVPGDAVPSVVAASWQRSFTAGVNAATAQAAFHADLDMSSRLMRCARPVIARLGDEMAQMPLSIVLTDNRARILSRSETDETIARQLDDVSLAQGFNYAEGSVGTNGIGTVLESGQPLYIVGPEHFHEQLQPFACAGSPIRDPLTGRIEGVLDITCLSEFASPLMHSLVRSATHDIEHNLLADRSLRQQALFDTFVRVDARSRGAVMAVGGTMVMGNAAAQNLFGAAEQRTIHEHARYLMLGVGTASDRIELSSGRCVSLHGKRVVVGSDVAGIVLTVEVLAEILAAPTVPASASPPRSPVASAAPQRGPSLLGKRAVEGVSRALLARTALLVVGEAGCGKLSLVIERYRLDVPDGHSVVVACAQADRADLAVARAVLARTGPGDRPGPVLVVFTNIDRLDTAGVLELEAFFVQLAASAWPVSVAATVAQDSVNADLPFQQLLAHFGQAVTVAPLRHRIDELPDLVAGLLQGLPPRRGATLSPAALRLVCRYSWPRNIRELRQALEFALLRRPVGEIQEDDLPGHCHSGAARLLTPLETGERDLIVSALNDAHGNRVHAAAALGIARSSLYRKIKSFGIDAA
ncbi:GAF domain-containing protein [Cryobacterium melibiosiphilum]|uniref:GAF domain-containing protein n=1 Tax=Cryobacterium melibiosiphilum TaxID=995039 RepID=A0A3A5MAM7_9MICO|nr:helix-turn-helix domain-containing protein [Cryobacterium melibiosiphilum]RJT85128.1 GAF domain-containing protein [Cryobacterium melibiosiphilum]